ncbi:hypothetical protein JHD48_04320 [Sulfurimonas sp. SAG-AH-194-I05]|nr:hypothetical protein [Sulfurimonas sp. SAG-AH-194-I05]MDF1874954.1 hypothetical protein [Sulfurimonas sp. SAG-AH-194-I05]
MQKFFFLFALIPTYIYALYNPFFSEKKVENKATFIKKTTVKSKVYYPPVKHVKRKKLEISYFGFVHSKKGKFALVRFNEKNIIIRKNDSLYDENEIYKVLNITSNALLLKDKYSRVKSIYFSSYISKNTLQ